MIFTEEVARQVERLPASGRRNVEAFFARYGIERPAFEDFSLRRFSGDAAAFYVSTVARGLAGSTSDIDLILVTDAAVPPHQSTSNMLFFGSRRVGVKLVSRQEIREALTALEHDVAALASSPDTASVATGSGPLRWVDLERIVNGVSFASDETFAPHLPILCRAVTPRFLVDFQMGRGLTALAWAAGKPAAGYAYASSCVLSAMDALMAACGRVQWNMKWTLERWRRFVAESLPRPIAEGVTVIERARPIFEGGLTTNGATATAALDAIAAFFEANLVQTTLPALSIAVAPEVRQFRFLPRASALDRKGRLAVVTDAVVSAAGSPVAVALDDRHLASSCLALTQLGFLQLASQGPNRT